MSPREEPQAYDRALKSLMGDEVADILPHLLPGAEYVSEENIEVDRSTLKADLVYDIIYTEGLPHILDVELQTEGDPDMPLRMALYHIGLLAKHKKPIISMIVYPFETSIPEPPFREMSGNRVLLMMEYHVVLLWKMEALPFLQGHVVCMYTLLPAMKGIISSNAFASIGRDDAALHAIQVRRSFSTVPEDSTSINDDIGTRQTDCGGNLENLRIR